MNERGEGLLDIVLGDAVEVCRSARTEQFTNVLHLTLRSSGAMKPGTFPIVLDTVMGGSGDAPQATVVLWKVYDVGEDLCAVSNDDQGRSGTITITQVTDAVVEGSMLLTREKAGSKIEGSFRAIACFSPPKQSVACPLAI
jgi:hypothetical protein